MSTTKASQRWTVQAADAMRWYTELFTRYHAVPPSVTNDSFQQIMTGFGTGQTAMIWHHTGSLIDVSTALGADSGKLGTLVRPAGPAVHIADVSYSYNGMSDPKNADADWAWLDHWAQPDTQVTFLESTGYFPSSTLRGLGVSVLTTHFQPTPEVVARHASRVRNVLAEHGLSIVQATDYNPQLTLPDHSALATELDRLRAAFDTARALGAEMIISGCGSHHPTHFYGPHAENHLPATRERLVASLRRLAPWAEDAGVILALECHVYDRARHPRAYP